MALGNSAGVAYISVLPDMGGFSSRLRVGMKAAAAGLLAAGAGAGVVIKQSIENAANLGEAINKTKVVFKGASGEVLNFSKTTANQLGISRAAALDAAGGYGAMFQALGLGRKASADMSTSLVTLAADMGSLHNQDPTEMLEKIRAGMSGEMEPLKQFGIVLSETAVAEEAVKMGLVGVGEELTNQEKVQARYSLLMKQSAVAHGDFGRTMNSLPNLQRRFSAGWTDLTAKLGKEFLPIATQVMGFLVNNLPTAINFLRNVFGGIGDAISNVIGWFRGLQGSTDSVQNRFAGFQAWIGKTFEDIKGIFRGFVRIIRVLWRDWGDEIVAIARRIWSFIGQIIQNALRIIKGIIDTVLGILTGDWRRAWNGIKNILGGLWETMKDLVSNAVGVIFEIVRGLWSTVSRIFRNGVENAVDFVRKIPGYVRDIFKNAAKWLINAGKAIIQGLIDGILLRSKSDGGIGGAIKDALKTAAGAIPGIGFVFQGDGLGILGTAKGGTPRALMESAIAAVGGGLVPTSGYRPGAITSSGNKSLHSIAPPWNAWDFAGSSSKMLSAARWLAATYGSRLRELIHTPLGFSIKNGQRTVPIAASDHYDHVHVADKGLITRGRSLVATGNITEAHIPLTGPGARSLGPTINVYTGDVYGLDDLDTKVSGALDRVVRRFG